MLNVRGQSGCRINCRRLSSVEACVPAGILPKTDGILRLTREYPPPPPYLSLVLPDQWNRLLTRSRWSQVHYWLRCSFPYWSHWTAKRTHKGAVLQRIHRGIRISVLFSIFAAVAWLRKNPRQGTQLLQSLRMGKALLLYKIQDLISN
jgi:hypothetical protein